ncbi:MAG: diaminopimelate epimerase [Muribaculaceae bacterium]|nr:diaminopimelate epimerase [Muribaculaceae bacterium]
MNKKDSSHVEFTKMQGAGNDYVYINGISHCPANLPELAIRIADRHFGVGGDGLVVILPSDIADFRMRMFNADGSEAQMCGNASRCVAKFLHDHKLTRKNEITLETLAGIKTLILHPDANGEVERVTVDMGTPILTPEEIPACPTAVGADGVAIVELRHAGRYFPAYAVSMGNPHGVIFTDYITDEDLNRLGPIFECSAAWPEKANIEFAKVIDSHTVEMRVWERGSGETLACGTGACATAVAGILTGRLKSPVEVRLRGGSLSIDWPSPTATVKMTGPAATVAEGRYRLPHDLASLPDPPRQR